MTDKSIDIINRSKLSKELRDMADQVDNGTIQLTDYQVRFLDNTVIGDTSLPSIVSSLSLVLHNKRCSIDMEWGMHGGDIIVNHWGDKDS